MAKFRKKPVVVEARQMTEDNYVDMAVWCGGAWYERFFFGKHQTMVVEFKEIGGRDVEAVEGDWIIKGVQGEFYPCKPNIFSATYEEVDAEASARSEDEQRAWVADQFLRMAYMLGDPHQTIIYCNDPKLVEVMKRRDAYGFVPDVVGAPQGVYFGWGPK